MKLVDFENPVTSEWLHKQGNRLDANPFLSGAVEAKVALEELSARKDALEEVTESIYHAGRESRTWVDDPEYGMPFMGSTDILAADLSRLPLISKKQVSRNPRFRVREGWTLITRSGTIGRTAYVRADMDGLACSEHVLRVVPKKGKIPPGYLYAYLSSRYGVSIITSGTYGAIIQHIEPEHIADLPVPRLGEGLERRVHELVQGAAEARFNAAKLIAGAEKMLKERLKLKPLSMNGVSSFGTSVVQSANLNMRLDAAYHSQTALDAEAAIQEGPHPSFKLKEVAKRLFKPPIFKRLWVDNPKYGKQFISGSDAYRFQAENPRFVSFKTPNFDQFILKRGWVVFQAAGQIYGLFGQPLFVSGWLEGIFCADDVYRVVPENEEDGAYLYTFFRTEYGEALVKRQASGNSIPRVWDPHVSDILVPWPDEETRKEIAKPIIEAHKQIAEALLDENAAIKTVEAEIEQRAA